MHGVAALEPPEHIGQRRPAMRDNQIDAGKAREMPRIEQPRHRMRRISDAADRVDEVVFVEPVIAAGKHRMHEQRGLARGRHLPERIEVGIVERAALALRLGTNHGAVEAGIKRLCENARGVPPALQRNGRERRESVELPHALEHVLVEET